MRDLEQAGTSRDGVICQHFHMCALQAKLPSGQSQRQLSTTFRTAVRGTKAQDATRTSLKFPPEPGAVKTKTTSWAFQHHRLSYSQLGISEADVKPWSKLQREVGKLFAEGLRLQIRCRAYRMASASGSTDLPRYGGTPGKDVICDYPREFGENATYHPYDTDVSPISSLLREYIDSPSDQLLNVRFRRPLADRGHLARCGQWPNE
jgi:hypothetical protein